MKEKTIKAWAVLGYNDKKPMEFGSMGCHEGTLSIFNNKKQAIKMAKNASWEVVRCEIIYQFNKDI